MNITITTRPTINNARCGYYSARDKGDLTKKFDQVCVWYRWKSYLSDSMKNGCWGVASGGIGQQRSYKVTARSHLKKK